MGIRADRSLLGLFGCECLSRVGFSLSIRSTSIRLSIPNSVEAAIPLFLEKMDSDDAVLDLIVGQPVFVSPKRDPVHQKRMARH